VVRAEGAEVCNIVLIMELKRIQRKRVKGWKMPENTVYVGRPTKWGNPFKIDKMYIPTDEILANPFNPKWEMCEDIDQALKLYKEHLDREIKYGRLRLDEIKGKNLACFCKEGEPCHADILLKLANL
jgi:hypothetical protein